MVVKKECSMIAVWKNIRISPKKLRVTWEVIRNKDLKWSLDFLKYAPKKWASLLYKIVHSAMSNAVNNCDQDPKNLKVSKLIINKWIVYKRWQAISRWRMHPILKRTSNVLVELSLKDNISLDSVASLDTENEENSKD